LTSRIPVKSADGKFAGFIQGNIYIKSVDARKHQLLKPPAWCIDKDAFDKLIRPAGVKLIRYIDIKAKKTYEVSIGAFIKNKGEVDWQYGRQYFLILKHWRVK
jgi:hypothetical protein